MEDYAISTHGIAHSQQDSMSTTTASNYLHTRLRQCREETKRSRRSDFGTSRPARDDDIFLAEARAYAPCLKTHDSSPVVPGPGLHRSDSAHASIGSASARKRGGVRETDEALEKLNKANFDLKMEVFHRRKREERLQEQVNALEDQLAATEKLAAERMELLHLNDQLVKELEKRDDAVKEAVQLICELEANLERVSTSDGQTKPASAQAEPSPWDSRALHVIPPSSPRAMPGLLPRTPSSVRSKRPSARVPSFLVEKKESTQTLREVYREPVKTLHPVKSLASLLSRRDSRTEDGNVLDADLLNSPRLSVLSESSFPSIYERSPARQNYDHSMPKAEEVAELKASNSELLQDHDENLLSSITKVNQWIEAGTSPLKIEGRSRNCDGLSPEPVLPPTPDSASTRMLRASRASIDHQERHVERAVMPEYTRLQPTATDTARQHESTSREETSTIESAQGSIVSYYDGFPTGGSIITGTPSRFQIRHASPPVGTEVLLNGDGVDKAPHTQPHHHRKSSAELHATPLTPRSAQNSTSASQSTPRGAQKVRGSNPVRGNLAHLAPAQGPGAPPPPISARASTRPVPQQQQSQWTIAANAAPPLRPAPSIRTSLTQKTHDFFSLRRKSAGPGSVAALSPASWNTATATTTGGGGGGGGQGVGVAIPPPQQRRAACGPRASLGPAGGVLFLPSPAPVTGPSQAAAAAQFAVHRRLQQSQSQSALLGSEAGLVGYGAGAGGGSSRRNSGFSVQQQRVMDGGFVDVATAAGMRQKRVWRGV